MPALRTNSRVFACLKSASPSRANCKDERTARRAKTKPINVSSETALHRSTCAAWRQRELFGVSKR